MRRDSRPSRVDFCAREGIVGWALSPTSSAGGRKPETEETASDLARAQELDVFAEMQGQDFPVEVVIGYQRIEKGFPE